MSDAIANALRIAAPQDPSGISRALIDALRQKAASGDPNAQAGMAQHDAAMANPLWGSSTYLSQQPANNLGEALQKVPPEAMFLSNFLGPAPKRLPMDTAARMSRAKEMGFDTDRVMYHGTNADFDSFKPSDRGALGPGVYLTQAPGVAGRYGSKVGEYYASGNILNTGPFKPIPEGLADRAKALLSPEEAARWDRLWPKPKDMGGYTIGNPDAEVFREVLTRSVEANRVPEIMKKLGYDGMEGIADGHEMVVFDPSRVRSVDAAFDPSKKTSANLLASSAAVAPAIAAALRAAMGNGDEN